MHPFFYFVIICFVLTETSYAKAKSTLNLSQKVENIENTLSSLITQTPLETQNLKEASATPNVAQNEWIASFSILYFKPQIQGSSFALSNNQIDVDLPIQGEIVAPTLDWNFGLKLSLGKVFDEQDFVLNGEFTYFTSNGSKKISKGIESSIIPLKGTYTDPAYFARSRIDFRFYNLDVNLYRDFFIGKTLSVKPSIGLKSTWATVHQNSTYANESFVYTKFGDVEETSKTWGLGPLGSFASKWYFCNNVFFFGKVSGSTLFSYVRADQEALVPSDKQKALTLSQKQHFFIPYLEFNLGLAWYKFLNAKKQFLQLSLSYENQYYWGLRQGYSLEEFKGSIRAKSNAEDVSIYGVNLTATLFF